MFINTIIEFNLFLLQRTKESLQKIGMQKSREKWDFLIAGARSSFALVNSSKSNTFGRIALVNFILLSTVRVQKERYGRLSAYDLVSFTALQLLTHTEGVGGDFNWFDLFVLFLILSDFTRIERRKKLTQLQAYIVAYYASDEVIANAGPVKNFWTYIRLKPYSHLRLGFVFLWKRTDDRWVSKWVEIRHCYG